MDLKTTRKQNTRAPLLSPAGCLHARKRPSRRAGDDVVPHVSAHGRHVERQRVEVHACEARLWEAAKQVVHRVGDDSDGGLRSRGAQRRHMRGADGVECKHGRAQLLLIEPDRVHHCEQ